MHTQIHPHSSSCCRAGQCLRSSLQPQFASHHGMTHPRPSRSSLKAAGDAIAAAAIQLHATPSLQSIKTEQLTEVDSTQQQQQQQQLGADSGGALNSISSSGPGFKPKFELAAIFRRNAANSGSMWAVSSSPTGSTTTSTPDIPLQVLWASNSSSSSSSNGGGSTSTDSIDSFSINGHASSRETQATLSSLVQQTPQLRRAVRPVSLLLVEIFAGSYSAGRLAARVNNQPHTSMRVSGYVAVELEKKFHREAPDPEALGFEHPGHSLFINGSITDQAVHGQLLQFVRQALRQSADGSGPRVDGVMLFGGPPCTNYSVLQNLNAARIREDPARLTMKQCFSDRLVSEFIALYGTIQAACAGAAHPLTQQPVPSCIVMENPASVSYLRVRYRAAVAAKAAGQGSRGVRLLLPLALRQRHFLQPYLSANGGPLRITTHNWCSYNQQHPEKPTSIFSDLEELCDAPCICKQCQPDEARLAYKHFVDVEGMKDAKARAVWPDAFVQRAALLFGSKVERQLRAVSSTAVQ